MPRNHYLIAEIFYFCLNLIILFESIWDSTTQYKLAYPYPPGYTPATPVNPPFTLDLEYFYPHHLDLPPSMKEIPAAPPLPNVPPSQDFILGLADQVVPHTGSCRPLATAVNYLVQIVPIVYIAFQAWPASPVGVQLDSGMGCISREHYLHVKLSKRRTSSIVRRELKHLDLIHRCICSGLYVNYTVD
ncbi:hypothetical protein DSO57_1017621 [Entomophthora muscae]|uniref:Uncharacterized protein n=1 Tax=Entomophthora muscae TaxID=34485 RepID=A0ACC2RVS4_9FUNG|nr:hypothetical protein DSO57_1017621 [Entomophthora muscae]